MYLNFQKKLTETGNNIVIDRNEIVSIDFSNIQIENYFFALGLTIGTPGFSNLSIGYAFKKMGLRTSIGLSSGGKSMMFDFQLNLLFNFYNGESVETGFSVGVGVIDYEVERTKWVLLPTNPYTIRYDTYTDYENFSYFGLFYHLNVYGFFIELGAGFGMCTWDSPAVLAQLGYIYRFN